MDPHIDFKFEQFLKRKFVDHEEYEQIYYYGIGILVQSSSKNYGRVVVSNKAIYWVKDPPKVVTKEIDIKDVIDVEMKDNYPDFLEGDFKKKCQHFQIRFLKPGKPVEVLTTTGSLKNGTKKDESVAVEDKPTSETNKVEVTKVGCCGRGKRSGSVPQPGANPPEDRPAAATLNEESGSVEESVYDDKMDITEPSLDLDYKMDETLAVTARSNYITEHNLVESSLDIYILNGDMKLLPCVNHAHILAVQRITLNLSGDHELLHSPLVIMEDETLNYHYRQLKEDLHASRYNPLQVFKYTNELCNAARRYFHIKKLFWSNEEMWDYYLKQLERIYPESRLDLTIRKHIIQRVDELELALLILELLFCMMDGTHMLPKRVEVFRTNQSSKVYKLLRIITTQPNLPQFEKHFRTTILKHAANETKVLLNEITIVCGDILHNLILDGTYSPPKDVDDFTEASIVSYFERNIDDCLAFLKQYILQVISLLKPPENRNIDREPEQLLQPHEVVQIYRVFSVLQSLIRYSLKIREFFVEEFSVDFKFRMQKHQVISRLSPDYPITYDTLKLVGHVTPILAGEKPQLLYS